MEDIYGDKKINTKTKIQSFVEPLNPYDELQFTLENGADIQDGIVYLRNADSIIDLMIKVRFFIKLRVSKLRSDDPITIFLDPNFTNEADQQMMLEYLNSVVEDEPCNMVSRGNLTKQATDIITNFKGGRILSAMSSLMIARRGVVDAQTALNENLIDQII